MSDSRKSAPKQPIRWLLLIHQIPQRPDYLRIRIGRLIAATGAVGLKASVYALPESPLTREAFSRVAQEIRRHGGEAAVCRAELLEGLTTEQVIERLQGGRTAAYGDIAEEARGLESSLDSGTSPTWRRRLAALRRRLAREAALDFFRAPGHDEASALLDSLSSQPPRHKSGPELLQRKQAFASLSGRLWITRRGVLADRIASAWLIRRFIDAKARFQFVAGPTDPVPPGAIRFDMPGGDFTHEGDRCTFEVLASRFRPDDAGLRQLAEIIHDIDFKDAKFGRAEAGGVQQLVLGLAQSVAEDQARIASGKPIFDALYQSFQSRKVDPSGRRSR